MAPDPLDRCAWEVLHRYPANYFGDLSALGNHGGFSGARLWRRAGFCLRAWPADDTFPARLDCIHALMTQARGSGLTFVPHLVSKSDLSTRVELGGRWWDITEWLPGGADYHQRPTSSRLEAACVALARLHLVWNTAVVETGVCPAVQRRRLSLQRFHDHLQAGWHPLQAVSRSDPLRPLVDRAATVLVRWLAVLPEWLGPWAESRWPLQPCLCDVWHDHLLFDGDRLSGLIDYGSLKIDHVTVDLARLLGSLVEDDEIGWKSGLAAYRSLQPLTAAEVALTRTLDRTGTVLAVANWLRWLFAEGRSFADQQSVARRLEQLVTRIEKWGADRHLH